MVSKRSDSPATGEEEGMSASQISTLSLFLLLLVFFLLMNSISEFSKKYHDILKSMRQAFGDRVATRIEMVGVAQELTVGLGTGMTLKDLGGLFQNEVPGLKKAIPNRSGELSITLPANEFNLLLGLTGSQQVHSELMTLLDFIKINPKVEYRLQLIKNVRPAVLANTTRRLDPTHAYLVVWADALRQLGLPDDKFEYGVASGLPGTVTLHIMAVRDLLDSTSSSGGVKGL